MEKVEQRDLRQRIRNSFMMYVTDTHLTEDVASQRGYQLADSYIEATRANDEEIARLRSALEASDRVRITACDFIDSHVADPDITDEMTENYERFRRARDDYGKPTRDAIEAYFAKAQSRG